MTINSSSSSNGSSNINTYTNANRSGSSDVFNSNNMMILMSLSIDNGDEAKHSIATFDANAFSAPDGSTYNEGMYDDDDDDSKGMYMKFLL